tara:strand:- start:421 stop:774 length:354 start_codon:yes stop_codon:yes gene_type:complete
MKRLLASLVGWKGIVAALGVVAVTFTGWGKIQFERGESAGRAEIRAERQKDADALRLTIERLNADLGKKSAALAIVQAKRAIEVKELEDAAANDPDADRRRPSDDSLRRLHQRFDAQ